MAKIKSIILLILFLLPSAVHALQSEGVFDEPTIIAEPSEAAYFWITSIRFFCVFNQLDPCCLASAQYRSNYHWVISWLEKTQKT